MMRMIYAYYFMYIVVYSIMIPTSGRYAHRVTGSDAYGGPLVATLCFGGLLAQPAQAWVLRALGPRRTYAAFCACFAVGNLLYALAHVAGPSIALLFLGRAISGAGSGVYLFFAVVDEMHGSPHERVSEVTYLTYTFQGGHGIALVVAALIEDTMPMPPDPLLLNRTTAAGARAASAAAVPFVNALTMPALVGAALAVAVGAGGLLVLRDDDFAREDVRRAREEDAGASAAHRPPEQRPSLARLAVALASVFFVELGEGLRQTVLFVMATTQWGWTHKTAALFASLCLLLQVLAAPLKSLVERRNAWLVTIAAGASFLLLAPWDWPYPAAAWVYAAAVVCMGFFASVAYSYACTTALAAAAVERAAGRLRWNDFYILCNAFFGLLGIGVGAFLSTTGEGAGHVTAPFVVAAVGLAVCGALRLLVF
jgi:MFS family permease